MVDPVTIMTLKIHFASLSLGASVDQQTGNLSIFDLLEEIRTPQLPIHLQSLVVSIALEKKEVGDYDGKMLIHIITPDQAQQLVGTGEMKIPRDQKRMKAVFRFGGFPVTHFGQHRFVLSCVNHSGVKIAESILDFEVMQVAQVAQGIAPSEKPLVSH
jgi:hypothetical protein